MVDFGTEATMLDGETEGVFGLLSLSFFFRSEIMISERF
jgi:hypothetical protein